MVSHEVPDVLPRSSNFSSLSTLHVSNSYLRAKRFQVVIVVIEAEVAGVQGCVQHISGRIP